MCIIIIYFLSKKTVERSNLNMNLIEKMLRSDDKIIVSKCNNNNITIDC